MAEKEKVMNYVKNILDMAHSKKSRIKWIMDYLDEIGVEHYVQESNHDTIRNNWIKYEYINGSEKKIRNLIIPSRIPTKTIITAHHDVVEGSFGYNDNGSGIAIILKMIEDGIPENCEIVFTDMEECGGRGSRAYLYNKMEEKESGPFSGMMNYNIDVCGWGNIIYNTNYGHNTVFDQCVEYPFLPFSDSFVFNQFKMPTTTFITSDETIIGNLMHTMHNSKNDNKIEILSNELMDKVKKIVQAKIWERA